MILSKGVFSAVAIALNFISFYPYVRDVLRGTVKPHVFSWIIWGITTCVIFLAQLEDRGGVGAWPMGLAGVLTFFVAFLAYVKKGDLAITRTDWIFFIAALSALPFWYFTSTPLWAVVILTAVDLLGFGPTVRKVFDHPRSESLTFYVLFTSRNLISIPALENFSVTTVLSPAVISLATALFIGMALYRRRVLSG